MRICVPLLNETKIYVISLRSIHSCEIVINVSSIKINIRFQSQ